jgi:hypothetical protein
MSVLMVSLPGQGAARDSERCAWCHKSFVGDNSKPCWLAGTGVFRMTNFVDGATTVCCSDCRHEYNPDQWYDEECTLHSIDNDCLCFNCVHYHHVSFRPDEGGASHAPPVQTASSVPMAMLGDFTSLCQVIQVTQLGSSLTQAEF